jgi:hypothetical protein
MDNVESSNGVVSDSGRDQEGTQSVRERASCLLHELQNPVIVEDADEARQRNMLAPSSSSSQPSTVRARATSFLERLQHHSRFVLPGDDDGDDDRVDTVEKVTIRVRQCSGVLIVGL